MNAPTGEWKIMWAGGFFAITLALWFAVWMRLYGKYSIWHYQSQLEINFGFNYNIEVYPEYPSTVSEEGRKLNLKRQILLEADPVDGLASKWDYENNRWKNGRPWWWF